VFDAWSLLMVAVKDTVPFHARRAQAATKRIRSLGHR